MGVNYFADWTVEEFRAKMLGVRMNKGTNKGLSSGLHLRLPSNIELPDEVDWRYLLMFSLKCIITSILNCLHLEPKALSHQLKIRDNADRVGKCHFIFHT